MFDACLRRWSSSSVACLLTVFSAIACHVKLIKMEEFREEPPPMNDHDDNDADRSDKEDDDLFSSAIDVRVYLFYLAYFYLWRIG